LKYVVLVGSYANLKDTKRATRGFYDANKIVDPVNMRLIRNEIRKNIDKGGFEEELKKSLFDPEERKKITEKINFEK
jgi:cobalamin biosynthesis Mg chelatase CobN